MSRTARDPSELQGLLSDSIGWLKTSADIFDAGALGEARRLAATLRLLLHDTSGSKSLLGQLGMKGTFIDTSIRVPDGHTGPFARLLIMKFSERSEQAAQLDNWTRGRPLHFDAWWNMVVLSDGALKRATRRDLVLVAANQDGGCHVDQALDTHYARFVRTIENALGTVACDGSGVLRELGGGALQSIRQVAHEVLNTTVSA